MLKCLFVAEHTWPAKSLYKKNVNDLILGQLLQNICIIQRRENTTFIQTCIKSLNTHSVSSSPDSSYVVDYPCSHKSHLPQKSPSCGQSLAPGWRCSLHSRWLSQPRSTQGFVNLILFHFNILWIQSSLRIPKCLPRRSAFTFSFFSGMTLRLSPPIPCTTLFYFYKNVYLCSLDTLSTYI